MVGRGRLPSTRREGGGGRLWVVVVRPLRAMKKVWLSARGCQTVRSLIAVRVAVIACGGCALATRRKTTKNDGV